MRKLAQFLLALMLAMVPLSVRAQEFGKNQVMWEKTTWNFYQSTHFDFYVSLELDESRVQEHFANLVAHAEGSYESFRTGMNHDLKKRPIVVVSRTHSTFEALCLGGDGFMPEGVGAYAMPRGLQLTSGSDLMLVVKPDFLPVLNKTIFTHELEHIFQFDMIGWSFQRLVGADPIDQWLYEGSADYLANLYAPYSRDDIRRIQQRFAGANPKNPMFGLPTMKMLKDGEANPYSMGAMVFEYLEAVYGRQRTLDLIVCVFKTRKGKFMDLVSDLSEGKLSTPEKLDRASRDYWASRYVGDSLKRPKPYDETTSFAGRQVLAKPWMFPLTSPKVSPDGRFTAVLTYDKRYGIVLALAQALPRQDAPYVPVAKRKKTLLGAKLLYEKPELKVLTSFLPPKHYEYLIGQELNIWPFNGSDLAWWQGHQPSVVVKDDKNGDKKPKAWGNIAFFARKNRDHALFIMDATTGKFLREIELPLDQAVSPAFSPDGGIVYFSAAHNIDRDIYALNLKTGALKNITGGGVFNTAPAVSPDGTKLAFVAFVGDFQKLFLLDLTTGAKQQLTYGRWNDNSPSWSSDGTLLAYTSDEKDGIWNLYSLDITTQTTKQWTEFFGGVFVPSFMPGENDRIVYSAYLEDDQFLNYIYPNYELFDARLKEPLRTEAVTDSGQDMRLAFRSTDVVREQLDMRQLENPPKPPARWRLDGGDVYLGANTYWGMFGSTNITVQDILANRTHSLLLTKNGDASYYDYTYTDRSRRWGFTLGATHLQFPMYYFLYSIDGQQPRYPSPDGKNNQYTLNSTWIQESSLTAYAQYPFSKWSRIELGIRPRRRTYQLSYQLTPDTPTDTIPTSDLQYYDFFQHSSGQTNLGLTAAFVHDTVLYSNRTFGPLHGNALYAHVEYGPPLDTKSSSYLSAQLDARKYISITGSSLLAVRVAGLASSRPNGDFMLLGGSDSLRNYPYFSVAGNQVGYGSAELRLPVAAVMLFGSMPLHVRAVAFGDYAVVHFSDDRFPAHREWSYGFGLQTNFLLPLNFEWARTKFNPEQWTFNFRIGFNF